MKRYRGLMVMAAIFFAGAVVGAFGIHPLKRWWFPRTPEAMEQRMTKHLTRSLTLDEAQQTVVKAIVHEMGQELTALKNTQRDQVDTMRREAGDRIRTHLRPNQVEMFDKMRREMDARRRQRMGDSSSTVSRP